MMRQPIEIPTQTVDLATGKPVADDGGTRMFLLPAKEGTCETCATAHEPHLPHNAQSLFYQTRFNIDHGRAATWADAMEHCTDDMRAIWTKALKEAGVDVDAGEINPKRGTSA